MSYADRYEQEDRIEFKVLSVRNQRAKKEHKCWTCGKPIIEGEVYYVIVALADGEFEWIKSHADYDCYPLA